MLPKYFMLILSFLSESRDLLGFYCRASIFQLVKTDGIQGFQFGNQKKRETSA